MLSTVLILAPVTLHRALYAHHEKARLVRVRNRLAQAGLTSSGLTLASVVLLIFGVTAGTAAE